MAINEMFLLLDRRGSYDLALFIQASKMRSRDWLTSYILPSKFKLKTFSAVIFSLTNFIAYFIFFCKHYFEI